jgi:N-methylhydantoinase A
MLGVDVGGTFTDFVSYDRDSKSLSVWKNLSTPADPTDGVLRGLERLDSPQSVSNMRLGTTVATNAILERKGARIAYLTTAGFRDIPFIQRGNRKHHYDSSWLKPKPLVKRRDAFDVPERVLASGEVLEPLDETAVRGIAEQIRGEGGIEAIAVNLLFSYVNPAHERRIQEILAEELPDVPVSISFEVLPKWKEYERASTTLADAYIKPTVQRYLRDVRGRFAEAGLTDHVVVIKSNGGEMTLEAAREHPIHMTLSGPTGGVVAAQKVAQDLGIDHLVTLDMGGTSTDCSTIIDSKVSFTTNFEIEFGLPVQVPMIDIRTIGAGGGSIAWIDKGGMLRVGPHSAGADPGPACYGFGGTEPTVTDANVVVGRISPGNFLGGTMALDAEKARTAMAKVAEPLGMTVDEAALSILKIVNNSMVGALRSVLVERGQDPRDFALLGFGGAGPLHTSDLMHDAGIPRGVIPIHPGQFSALGFIVTDARVDLERTVQMTSQRFDVARATEVLNDLVATATRELADQGYTDDLRVSRTLELRYLGQNYELEVPLDFETFTEETARRVWDAFHALHKARFGFNIPGEVIEVITVKCTAVSITEKPTFLSVEKGGGKPAPTETRSVAFEEGRLETAVHRRPDLRWGDVVEGPALIEEAASVTVVRPGHRAEVAEHGHLILSQA